MVRKRITKASRRRLLFFGTISIGLIGYFIFSITYYSMNLYHLQKEEKKLTQNLSSLKYDEKLLKTEIEKLKDPDYLARYARENYLYSKDGEIVIKVQKENPKIEETSNPPNYTYILLGGIVVLVIIIGYVIKKSKK